MLCVEWGGTFVLWALEHVYCTVFHNLSLSNLHRTIFRSCGHSRVLSNRCTFSFPASVHESFFFSSFYSPFYTFLQRKCCCPEGNYRLLELMTWAGSFSCWQKSFTWMSKSLLPLFPLWRVVFCFSFPAALCSSNALFLTDSVWHHYRSL